MTSLPLWVASDLSDRRHAFHNRPLKKVAKRKQNTYVGTVAQTFASELLQKVASLRGR